MAQNSDLGSYSIINLNAQVGKKTELYAQSRLHHYGVYENLRFFLVRGGFTYAFHRNVKLHLGAATAEKQPFEKSDFGAFTRQNWVYEELYINFGKSSGFKMTNRFRQENRFITPNDRSGTYRVNLFRYRMQFSQALGKSAYVKVFDELFYDIDKKELNRHRYRGGIGVKISPETTVEFGYVKEGFNKVFSNYVVTAIYFKSDFRNNQPKPIIPFDDSEINPSKDRLELKEGLEVVVPEVSNEINTDSVANAPMEVVVEIAPEVKNEVETPVEITVEESPINVANEEALIEAKTPSKSAETTAEEAPTKEATSTYYIITGSFSDVNNLNKHLAKLKREGFSEAKNIGANAYFNYRVSIKEFNNLVEARKFLNKIKTQGYPKAWILINPKK